MLTVFPIQTKEEQKMLCDICGVAFIENAFAYKADRFRFAAFHTVTTEGDLLCRTAIKCNLIGGDDDLSFLRKIQAMRGNVPGENA